MEPKFFPTPEDLRQWLAENHEKLDEQWIGFYKKSTGIPSITWPESVDQALCYGWIDGLRKSIDGKSYKIRFTPRRPKSTWSAVNIKRIAELKEMGLMQAPGLAAFERRTEKNSEIYSYERDKMKLDPAYEAKIRENEKAWAFWQKLAPSYKKSTTHWVMSAKQEATRQRRLGILIQSSEEGLKIPLLRRKK